MVTLSGAVESNHGEFTINNNEPGEITMQLREALTGLQRGAVEDTCGWNTTID